MVPEDIGKLLQGLWGFVVSPDHLLRRIPKNRWMTMKNGLQEHIRRCCRNSKQSLNAFDVEILEIVGHETIRIAGNRSRQDLRIVEVVDVFSAIEEYNSHFDAGTMLSGKAYLMASIRLQAFLKAFSEPDSSSLSGRCSFNSSKTYSDQYGRNIPPVSDRDNNRSVSVIPNSTFPKRRRSFQPLP